MDAMRVRIRRVLWLGVVAALAGLIVGGVGWWQRTTSPEYRLQKGREALRRGDRAEAERMVQLLLADGQADHAHLLRGEALFHQQQYGPAISELNRLTRASEGLRVD